MVDITRKARSASPVKMLLMLAPPGLRRPSPLEMRCSMTVASSGWLATRSRRAFFSHQRKLGMPSLLPCRMPAWLAGVVEGSSASQWPSLCVPDRIQLDISGTRPARTEWLMTSWERPSTWMMTRPGWSVFVMPGWRLAMVRTSVP